jgi:hypothetical protein
MHPGFARVYVPALIRLFALKRNFSNRQQRAKKAPYLLETRQDIFFRNFVTD